MITNLRATAPRSLAPEQQQLDPIHFLTQRRPDNYTEHMFNYTKKKLSGGNFETMSWELEVADLVLVDDLGLCLQDGCRADGMGTQVGIGHL